MLTAEVRARFIDYANEGKLKRTLDKQFKGKKNILIDIGNYSIAICMENVFLFRDTDS